MYSLIITTYFYFCVLNFHSWSRPWKYEIFPFYGTWQLFTFVFCFFHKLKSLRMDQSCPFVTHSSCIPHLTSTHSASNALGFFVTLSSSKVLKSFNRVFSTSYSHTCCLHFIPIVPWDCLCAGVSPFVFICQISLMFQVTSVFVHDAYVY